MRERLFVITVTLLVVALVSPSFAGLKFNPQGLAFDGENYTANAGDTVTIVLLDDTNEIFSFYTGGIIINHSSEDYVENITGELNLDTELLGDTIGSEGLPVTDSILQSKKVRLMKILGTKTEALSPSTPVYTLTFDIKSDTPVDTILTIDDFADGTELPDDENLDWDDSLTAVTQADFGPGLGEVTIDPISIKVVPEPFSLALLGLGGLVLRRRFA